MSLVHFSSSYKGLSLQLENKVTYAWHRLINVIVNVWFCFLWLLLALVKCGIVRPLDPSWSQHSSWIHLSRKLQWNPGNFSLFWLRNKVLTCHYTYEPSVTQPPGNLKLFRFPTVVTFFLILPLTAQTSCQFPLMLASFALCLIYMHIIQWYYSIRISMLAKVSGFNLLCSICINKFMNVASILRCP